MLTWCGTGQRIQATAQPIQEASLRQLREGASRNAGRLEVARTYQPGLSHEVEDLFRARFAHGPIVD